MGAHTVADDGGADRSRRPDETDPDTRVRLNAPPDTLDDDPRLAALASPVLVGVEPDTPVGTALRAMIAREVRHLPVLDGARCVGMVTEADLLRGLAAGNGPFGHTTLLVRDLAGPAVVLPGGTRLSRASARMIAERVDAVLLGGSDGVHAIVTATDVLRHYSRQHPDPRPPS